ncbi:hypothetical protein [Stackebrandtia soli]|uniref:hypothetical protein n=1 Tax=Stackebrandtia soli TaxID=1892856 RepID=UPI0039EC986E
MGQVADDLKALIITATSPDGDIKCTLKGREAKFGFRPGRYHAYDERALESQLGRLLTLMSIGYRRGHSDVMRRAGLVSILRAEDAHDEAQARYLRAAAELSTVGRTARNIVRFKATGMREWRCRVLDGALSTLSEEDFVTEAQESGRALIQDYRRQIRFLRDECFGLDIPSVTRERERRQS